MPTRPLESMTKTLLVAKAAVELDIEKRWVVCPDLPATESVAYGELVPMPKLPAVEKMKVLDAASEPPE